MSTCKTKFHGFGPSGRYKGLPRRFKKTIYSIDSSTIALVANCMDWDRHRRRKAAAKLHLCLNLQTFLPSFAVIDEGAHHDSSRMIAMCARLVAGEIAIFDRAYVHFQHLFSLTSRGIVWDRFDLAKTLRFYETAGGQWRMSGHPQSAYLRGIAWKNYGIAHG